MGWTGKYEHIITPSHCASLALLIGDMAEYWHMLCSITGRRRHPLKAVKPGNKKASGCLFHMCGPSLYACLKVDHCCRTQEQTEHIAQLLKQLERTGQLDDFDLAGSTWRLLYSTSKASSGGKFGPFIGRVTQVLHSLRPTIDMGVTRERSMPASHAFTVKSSTDVIVAVIVEG